MIEHVAVSVGALVLAVSFGAAVPGGTEGSTSPAVTTGQSTYLLTDAPTSVRLGADVADIPVTLGFRNEAQYAEIDLVDPAGDEVATDRRQPNRTTAKLYPTLVAGEITRYGTYRWDVLAVDHVDGARHTLSVATSVRANSLLGFTGHVVGTTVVLSISARQWHNSAVAPAYTPYPTGVHVQKLESGVWTNVDGITLPASGNATRTVQTGAGEYRVYDHDAPDVWGRITPAVLVD